MNLFSSDKSEVMRTSLLLFLLTATIAWAHSDRSIGLQIPHDINLSISWSTISRLASGIVRGFVTVGLLSARKVIVDFKKAFDSVHRETLWNIVKWYGVPDEFTSTLRSMCNNSSCCVRTNNGNTDFFEIVSGVRQGCILLPLLFLLVIDFVSATAEPNQWTAGSRLTDLDFADDIALLAETRSRLQ